MKKLLVSEIRHLVANTGVQSVIIEVVETASDADLRVGQVSKNWPLAQFEHLGFEAVSAAFGLGRTLQGVIVALAAAALRAHGPVPVQQDAVGVAAVLFTVVGVDDKLGRGGPVQQHPL